MTSASFWKLLIVAAALVAALAAATGVSGARESSRTGGATILFWRACGTGCADAYLVDRRGRERRLTRGRRAIDPAWAPDRRSIVFASDAGVEGRFALYRRRVADGRETRLTLPRDASDTAPAVRRDGAIAFVRAGSSGIARSLMLLVNGRLERLARGNGLGDPAWSPDGRRIAYTELRAGVPQVVVRDLRTGRTQQVTSAGGAEAAWAPDGRRLAYFSDGRRPGIVVRDLAGGRARAVVARVDARSPDFSADGRWLVFSAEVSATRAGTALYLVPAGGGAARRLTRPPALAHDIGGDW